MSPSQQAVEIVSEMTLEEKIRLLSGSNVWETAVVERLGVSTIKVTDGPNGARGDSTTGERAVCLPASIAMAATFDADLIADVGRLLGRETVRKGSHVLLAPTINIAKHPLGGRNFESFGEDPMLTSAMAAAYISGVQEEGVGACAKHLVANDVEYARLTVSSEVDERSLREIYLAPFEAAAEADVWTMMAAYPKLNGEHCTEHHWLLTELLRDEWGYDGLVMSDWGATHHRSRPVLAGLDLEMPGPPLALGEHLAAAVAEGEVAEATVSDRAARVVDLVIRAGRLNDFSPLVEQGVDLPEEQQLAARVAADGMVLVTNTGLAGTAVLPFEPAAVAALAVIGPNADPGVIQGGGSAELPAHRVVSPLAGIASLYSDTTIVHEPGCLAHRYLPLVDAGQWASPITHHTYNSADLTGTPVHTDTPEAIFTMIAGGIEGLDEELVWSMRWNGSLRITETGSHQFSVLAVGPSRVFINGELVVDNWTDPVPGDAFFQKASAEQTGSIDLEAGAEAEVVVEWSRGDDELLAGLRFGHLPPTDEDAMMQAAVDAAAAADAAVVVVGLNADWETESHDRPMFGLPGRQDELVRRVVAANRRTAVVINAGGPLDLPWLEEVPAALIAWYPGQEFGTALASVLSGRADPGGRMPVTVPRRLQDAPTFLDVPGDGSLVHYREGLFVGHRWYDSRNIDPLIPFGHGLSYADFEIADLEPTASPSADGSVTVVAEVTNTSDRDGKCVVQAYVEPPIGPMTRPVRHLGGFTSVRLAAGEHGRASITVKPRSFEVWEPGHGWTTPSGRYRIHLGLSSRQLVTSTTIEVG